MQSQSIYFLSFLNSCICPQAPLVARSLHAECVSHTCLSVTIGMVSFLPTQFQIHLRFSTFISLKYAFTLIPPCKVPPSLRSSPNVQDSSWPKQCFIYSYDSLALPLHKTCPLYSYVLCPLFGVSSRGSTVHPLALFFFFALLCGSMCPRTHT